MNTTEYLGASIDIRSTAYALAVAACDVLGVAPTADNLWLLVERFLAVLQADVARGVRNGNGA